MPHARVAEVAPEFESAKIVDAGATGLLRTATTVESWIGATARTFRATRPARTVYLVSS